MSDSGYRTTARLGTGSATMGLTHGPRSVVAYAVTATVIVIEVAVAIVSAVAIVIATRVPVIAVTMAMVIATAYTHHHAYP